jgi:AraC-like DNA-binding protein
MVLLDMKSGKIKNSFPGLDKCGSKMAYRSPGVAPRERFGAGFLKKDYQVDFEDHMYPRFVLVIVLRGSGTYVDDAGFRHDIYTGSCFKRFPDKPHSTYIDEGCNWVEFFLEIGPALYQALLSMRIIRTSPPVEPIMLDDEFIERLWQIKERILKADETELPVVVGEMVSLLGECRRRIDVSSGAGNEAALLDEACAFLSSDFDRGRDLKKFCRRHGVGYESFRKIFKDKTGISPWQYRIRRRLDQSCGLLQNPELKISDIASELGYSSPYEFSAQFKKHFGVSPQYYRDGKPAHT